MDYKDAVEYLGAPVEPSKDEKRNGWSTETLTVYLAERKMGEASRVLDRPIERPTQTICHRRWLRR